MRRNEIAATWALPKPGPQRTTQCRDIKRGEILRFGGVCRGYVFTPAKDKMDFLIGEDLINKNTGMRATVYGYEISGKQLYLTLRTEETGREFTCPLQYWRSRGWEFIEDLSI